MKWLVCGGRDLADSFCSEALVKLAVIGLPSIIIHGGYRGADSAAEAWAYDLGIHTAAVKAMWDRHKSAAGPLRNSAMLLLTPDLVVALPGGRGTGDMVSQAKEADVPVVRYEGGNWIGYVREDNLFHDHYLELFKTSGFEVQFYELGV